MAKIEITNLKKAFGKKHVLNGLNLSVQNGESLVVIGGSGSGKSVLLKSIIGLINPDSGSVKINDIETTKMSAKQHDEIISKFGYLFQGGALFDSLKIWENVAFGLISAKKIPPKLAKEIALKKLKSVGLDSYVGELFPSELSGGMQKRVALARAIACEPEIIFFDEPTTGLDPIMADVINDLIIKCSSELGATTITITHDMASAFKIADKIAMIYNGEIIWAGDSSEVRNSNNPYVEQFINGSSKGPIEIKLQDH